MDKQHPDAAAIDRLGVAAIRAYFGISRQAIAYWRKRGVPRQHRKTMALLGGVAGHEMPEMADDR